jgi:hypothetical protein
MDAKFDFKLFEVMLCNAQAISQVTNALEDGRGAAQDRS